MIVHAAITLGSLFGALALWTFILVQIADRAGK
jgi:hypothetical protein